jgi:HSP20 family protein
MALTTRMVRDPFFFDLAAMEHAVREQRFDEFFSRMLGRDGEARHWIPTCDVLETREHYLVLVDLPGVKEDKITLECEDGMLTIAGERTRPAADEARRLERPIGEFVRSLALPHEVEAGEVVASYSDGVLEIQVPKPAEHRHKPQKIPLKGAKTQRRTSRK